MSDTSAIRLLQTAIENVRETCTGSEYKDLLAACDACDKAAEAASSADAEGSEPRTLKDAGERARSELKTRNKSASDSSK